MASGLTPFDAVIVNGYGPPEPAAGVPASVAVPFLLSVNVTPDGSAPVSDNVELGTPVVVTVKVPVWPVVKMVPAGLVIWGTEAVDPGRRGDASAACAWLSDPTATANMVRTNASFLYIDSLPRSSYR